MLDMHTLDLHFRGKPHTIAAFVLETGEGPVLIETGPHSTIQYLEEGLARLDYRLEDVKHVLLTHIHLDHAGAAWAFAERGAGVYVHPAGARHLVEPEKLLQSAKRIYQDAMDQLWGTMNPIAAEALQQPEDGAVLEIGGLRIQAWHTPGHAVHHIAWQIEDQLFAGDVAGVKIDEGLVVPPCPPPDINIEAWQRSIQRMRSLNLSRLHLTHFGAVDEVDPHLDMLEKRLTEWAEWIRPYYEQGASVEEVTPKFQAYVQQQLTEHGIEGEQLQQYENANPSWMSVAGLMRYWRKKAEGKLK